MLITRVRKDKDYLGELSWMGSLLNEQRDASGQMYRRNRYYDPASGRFTQEDPIGIAGGLNVYGFANGDPVSYADPYGLSPDWVYDIKGNKIGDKGGEKQHYLVHDGREYKLDRPVVSNSKGTSYVIFPDGVADQVAISMANAEEPRNKALAAFQSRQGGDLDFKRKGALAYPRQLFIIGDQAVHTDVVGNMAWGYFVRTKLNMSMSSAITWAQRYAGGDDDPNDIQAIRRAYTLPTTQP